MIVVLDSSAIYGDPMLRRLPARILLAASRQGQLRLVLPEVVISELPKLYREQLDAAARDVCRGLEKLAHLGVTGLPNVEIDRQALLDAFEPALRDRLTCHGAETAPVPQPDHADLVSRAVAERKPFGSKSRGYRDVLIWLTVLDLALQDEVALVSKDGDFGRGEPPSFHEEMIEDLADLDLEEDRVLMYRKLENAVSGLVPVSEQVLVEVRDLLENQPVWAEELEATVRDLLDGLSIDSGDEVTLTSATEGEIEDVLVVDTELRAVRFHEAYELDDERHAAVEIEVDADVALELGLNNWSAEWITHQDPDVDVQPLSETRALGFTQPRPLRITYAAHYDRSLKRLYEWEKVLARDRPEDQSEEDEIG